MPANYDVSIKLGTMLSGAYGKICGYGAKKNSTYFQYGGHYSKWTLRKIAFCDNQVPKSLKLIICVSNMYD